MEHEAHNPALLHHFSDAQQQKNAASLGMWLFLVTKSCFSAACSALILCTPCALQRFGGRQPAAQHSRWEPSTPPSYRKFGHGCFGRESGGGGQAQLLVGYLVVTVPAGLTFLVVRVSSTTKIERITYRRNVQVHRHFDDTEANPGQPEGSRTLLLDLFCHDRACMPAHDHRLRPFSVLAILS